MRIISCVIISESMRQYRSSFSEKRANIKQALDSNDWAELKSQVHKIKGSAGSYGFDNISQISGEIATHLEVRDYENVQSLTEIMLQEMHAQWVDNDKKG